MSTAADEQIRCEWCSKPLTSTTLTICPACLQTAVPSEKGRRFVEWLEREHPELIKPKEEKEHE